jgi:hypothetical protein
MKNGRPRPRHAFHHHHPQRVARYVDPIPQGVGAQQAGAGIVAEDIHQRPGVDRIDVLCVERQTLACEPVGDAGMHRAQPLDCSEQA